MQKLIHSTSLVLALGLLVLGGSGCSRQAKVERHMARADRYFQAGDYDRAEIEYKNVLQIEPLNGPAMGKLGSLYFDQNRVLTARSLLLRASELVPEKVEFMLTLGLTDLAVRDFAAARTKAEFVLDRMPGNAKAPQLLAASATDAKAIAEVTQRLKSLPAAIVETAPVHTALGLLELRQNKPDLAEAEFKKALVLDPKSVEAHAALSAAYMQKDDLKLAGAELKLAADLSPARSPERVQYAQFLIQQGETETGRQLLLRMTQETPDYLPAWISLAQLASLDKKYDEALGFVSRVLARDNVYPDAMLLNARLHLAKGEFAEAATDMERALKFYPSSPQFHNQLALAHAASGDARKAIDSLNQALLLAPGYTEATVLRAGLQMRVGDRSSAISSLRGVLQQHPDLIQAWLLLADAYRGQDSPEEAVAVYDTVEKNFPGNPRTPLLKGLALLQAKKTAEARASFQAALERSPDLEPAIEQLVNLDLLEKKFPAAQKRVDDLIQRQPKLAEAYVLRARVHAAQQKMDLAEADLQKAVEIQPGSPTPYFLLAALHMVDKEPQKALENLEQILVKNPTDVRALIMTGMLNDQLKQYDQALAAYEKLLTVDPNSGIALNNAAVLYSEHFNQLDKAFAAAQRARELHPHEPHLADTLGWILVKRRQYSWALSLLQESADKLTTSAEVQYHLGVVHYLLGNEEAARQALENTLKLGPTFTGRDDARIRLAVLGVAPGQAGTDARKIITDTLATRPDDPVALVRLASMQEKDGETNKAVATYQAALKASPTNVAVMLKLVDLYVKKDETSKAIDLAREARKQDPESVAATIALGGLAYQTRDFPRAFNLWQEVARKRPDDPDVQRELAQAAYSVGQVAAATTALRRAQELDAISPRAIEAAKFLKMIGFADNVTAAAAAEAARVLQSRPNDVPALMTTAAAREQKPDAPAAIASYEKILEQFPDFTPAKRRLVILYAETAGDTTKALDLASKARAAYPEDAALAKAYGIILYRQGDFPRALLALREALAQRDGDAGLSFYLGMTQYRLKDPTSAKKTLQRALDLKLPSAPAAEARQVLAEIK